jgi:hypothetical protein
MEKIESEKQFESLVNKGLKYVLWEKKVGTQVDFSVLSRKYKNKTEEGIIVEDYSNINENNPGKGVKKSIDYKSTNWLVWDVYALTNEEGDEYYKELLVKNLNDKK